MRRRTNLQIWMPRVMFLGVTLLVVQFGLGFFARNMATRTIEGSFGTNSDVRSSRFSLLNRQIVLGHLQIENPRHVGTPLFEADRCEVDLTGRWLLHKNAVVDHARISGLRVAALDASANDAEDAPHVNWFQEGSEAAAHEWLADLAEKFQHQSFSQLESVKRAESFCANWAARSAALEARGDELNQRLSELGKSLEAAETNPLRGAKFVSELPKTIADLRSDFAGLTADLEKLPDELETERRAIVAARKQDDAIIRKQICAEPIDATALTAYLMRTEVAKPLDELVAWLRWTHTAAPAGSPTLDSPQRGENLFFAGTRREPNLLIRALELRGSVRIGGQLVDMRGTLNEYSTQPELTEEPLKLRIETTGAVPAELQATFDRTHGNKRDTLLLDCQGIVLPRQALGSPDGLAINIDPSMGALSVSLAVDGDRLTGEVQLVQQNVKITPVVGSELAHVPIGEGLTDSLGRVNSLATRVSLGGTLAEPTCTLWSNVGPAVAEAVERAVNRASGPCASQRLVEAEQHVDEQLATVERQMSEQQTRWSALVSTARQNLQQLATDETNPNRFTPARVGRLPSDSRLR
jgi:uncharacterized protein (TIGR03545 family)